MTSTTANHTEFEFSDHAIERFCQRFRRTAGLDSLLNSFDRAEWVSAGRLISEAKSCGRPIRITRNSGYLRDEQTGAVFVTKPHNKRPDRLMVVTILIFRRPMCFKEWEC